MICYYVVSDVIIPIECWCFRAEVEIVRSNIDVLVKEGLGPRAEQDYGLAADTCTVLLKLAGKHKVHTQSLHAL